MEATYLEEFKFINELYIQINEFSEFSLVDRVHKDFSWRTAFLSRIAFIDKQELLKEYTERYLI